MKNEKPADQENNELIAKKEKSKDEGKLVKYTYGSVTLKIEPPW